MDKMDLILQKLDNLDKRLSQIQSVQEELKQDQERQSELIETLIEENKLIKQAIFDTLDRVKDTHAKLAHVGKHIRLLESDVDLILQKVSTHEREINRLKKVD